MNHLPDFFITWVLLGLPAMTRQTNEIKQDVRVSHSFASNMVTGALDFPAGGPRPQLLVGIKTIWWLFVGIVWIPLEEIWFMPAHWSLWVSGHPESSNPHRELEMLLWTYFWRQYTKLTSTIQQTLNSPSVWTRYKELSYLPLNRPRRGPCPSSQHRVGNSTLYVTEIPSADPQ
jgi:hypothetical protein